MKKKHMKREKRRSPYDPIYERSQADLIGKKQFNHLTKKLRENTDEKIIKVRDSTLHSNSKLLGVVDQINAIKSGRYEIL